MGNHDESRWRTLIVVESVQCDRATVRIPGWDPKQRIVWAVSKFPSKIRPKQGEPPRYYLATVNLAAGQPKDLKPSYFEIAPRPVDEESLG